MGIIVVEPVGRNTAACAAVAAEIIAQDDPNALVLLLPTDHEVGDENAFRVAVAEAAHAARAGELVVFGVRPTRPETGYGYVLAGENIGASMRVVERFVEKPDARTAEAYLTDGRYFWNAGILLARPDKLLLELDRYRPDILAGARTALSRAKLRDGALHLDPSLFAACPAESLDYAVLEQTRCAALILVDMGWSDLGGFDAIYEISSKDAQGNAGDTAMLIDVNNTLVRTDGYAVAAVGVSDLTIIVHNGVVLVSARNRAEDVARLSAEFRSGGMKQAN